MFYPNWELNFNFQIHMKQFCEDLLNTISHDLRGPLTNMYSLIDLIERTDDPLKKSEFLVCLRQMVQKQEEVVHRIFKVVEIKSSNVMQDDSGKKTKTNLN